MNPIRSIRVVALALALVLGGQALAQTSPAAPAKAPVSAPVKKKSSRRTKIIVIAAVAGAAVIVGAAAAKRLGNEGFFNR